LSGVKRHSLLCLLATTGAIAASFALPHKAVAAPLFAVSASALVLCIVAADYGGRRRYIKAYDSKSSASERLPLAA
jgi:hypothetical protein